MSQFVVEYLDDGEWIELRTFAERFDAEMFGEDEYFAYSGEVTFRVRKA